MDTETRAAMIAADLALAIHQGMIRAGEQLPSQADLMKAYRVAMGTASAALTKVADAGFASRARGKGTFALDLNRRRRTMVGPIVVFDLLDASAICRSQAAIVYGRNDTSPTFNVGGDPGWDDPHADREKYGPPRNVDADALVVLDRHLLRWMSEAFIQAARRIVGHGQVDADDHLVAAARSIIDRGGRRPDHQPAIAERGGPTPDTEDFAFRIWPERRPTGPIDLTEAPF